MATTVSSILKASLQKLGQLQVNAATGGSTTTVVDSNLGGAENDFVGGSLIILRDAGGVSSAPEGEFSEITGYSGGTGTFAINALTTGPVATDIYGHSTGKDYPHYQMIEFINEALQVISDYPQVDTTSLDTASNQTEYAYPVALKRFPPHRIDIQTRTTDANDNRWKEINRGLWDYVPAAPGSTGLIIFTFQPSAKRDLRLWYKLTHGSVYDYDDVIYEGYDSELVVWETVYQALLWKLGQRPGDENIISSLNNAENKRIEAAANNTVWEPPRKSKLLILGRTSEIDQFSYPGPA